MEVAKILADNQEYLKINNIEKAMGLKKTALVRMIARKEISEKNKEKVEKWWASFLNSLAKDVNKKYENIIPEIDPKQGDKLSAEKTLIKDLTNNIPKTNYFINTIDKSDIERQIKEWQNKKCPSYMGLQTFKNMQEKEIKELESQLK